MNLKHQLNNVVISTTKHLSLTEIVSLSSNLDNLNYSYVDRTFPELFKMRQYDLFSSITDFEVKNHTKFYLSSKKNIIDIINKTTTTINPNELLTTFKIGGYYVEFLKREEDENNNYSDNIYADIGTNQTNTNTTKFFLNILDDNTCKIYHIYENKKYYLTLDSDVVLYFISELGGVEATTFKFIYSKINNSLYLSTYKNNILYNLIKDENVIKMVEFSPNLTLAIIANPILIDKDIFENIGVTDFSNFIRYDKENNIDSFEDSMSNNFLFHRTDIFLDIIYLKNQLLQNDVFSSSNNLLSSSANNFYVDDLREYTSIFKDIDSETDGELIINYAFYNKPYTIKSGVNKFSAPDNMEPFIKLNINDTKFTNSGAFAYPTPEYADKVILVDDNQTTKNGQSLLFTWLSGSPLSQSQGVWVDRYYYPDLVSKKDALVGVNNFNPTYEDPIEGILIDNSVLSSKIEKLKFFDKKSDLVFKPNYRYEYHRLKIDPLEFTTPTIEYCEANTSNSNINYFKTINENGKFTTSFYFYGDDKTWMFESEKNDIEGGLVIEKNGNIITFKMTLYDISTTRFEYFVSSVETKPLKLNFVGVSLDVLKGVGYFFMNQELISIFDLPERQYYGKPILYGDFVIEGDNALTSDMILKNFQVRADYTTPEFMFLKTIFDGVSYIDDISITLPCGMRNSSDSIEYLQSVCSNNSFKSNRFNVIMKNVDIGDNIKTELGAYIKNTINNPITSNIKEIKFNTFK